MKKLTMNPYNAEPSDLISRKENGSLTSIREQIEKHPYLDRTGNVAIEALSADAVQGWTPCEERLPEPPSFCLVTTDGSHNDVIDIALYMSDGWHKASRILAWMPLPKPYKESEVEE